MSNKPPPTLDSDSDYNTWKRKLTIWQLGTSLAPEKQCANVIGCISGKYEPFVLKLTNDEIKSADGVQTLVQKLDLVFKDADDDAFKKYKEFQNLSRNHDEEVVVYVQRFADLYEECKKQDLTVGDKVLALKLLETANLNSVSTQMILTAAANLTYDDIKKSFMKIMKTSTSSTQPETVTQVKTEPVNYALVEDDYDIRYSDEYDDSNEYMIDDSLEEMEEMGRRPEN